MGTLAAEFLNIILNSNICVALIPYSKNACDMCSFSSLPDFSKSALS